MTVTGKLYGLAIKSAFNKEIDWDTDTIRCMLCTSSYTPNQDTHQYKSSVDNEVTGTAYNAGGGTVGNCTVTYTGATNVLMLDGDDVSWASSTITARTAVVYDGTPGADASRPLICYQQNDADISSSNGTFTVSWNASGIVAVTVS